MPRLPAISENPWGEVLNDFLAVGHGPAGEHRFDCPTLNDLRALNVAHGSQAIVSGYGFAGDGGGGTFYYDENSSDPDDDGTIITPSSGSGRWLRLFTEYRPEFFGAVGDGVEDDAAAVQACVDAAEAVAGSVVLLKPEVTYAVASSIVVGSGAYSIRVEGIAKTNWANDQTPLTFTKAANVPAIVVPPSTTTKPAIRGIAIKGRGAADPSLTDLGLDSTPGMLIQGQCSIDDILFYRTGGVSGYSCIDEDAIGSALCIVQREGAEIVNGITARGLAFRDTRGGVFIGQASGTITNGPNTQSILIEVDRMYNVIGYGISGTGARNQYRINNFYGPASTAQFYMRSSNSIAIAEYAEQNTPLCAVFGGARSVVSVADSTKYTALYSGLVNNTFICRGTQTTYLGSATGGYNPAFLGAAGVKFDAMSLPNTLADGYVKISEAAYGDFGAAFDIVSVAAGGTVTKGGTWTAKMAKIGVNVLATINLQGTLNVASANSSRLTINSTTTGMAFENMGNLGGALCALYLTNSAVTAKPVFLVFTSTTGLSFRDKDGAAMTFNDVVGAGAFTLSGTIMLMDAGGMA